MAKALSNLVTSDAVATMIQSALRDKAARSDLTEAEYLGLNVRVSTHYNATIMAMHLKVSWRDPTDGVFGRCIDHFIPQERVGDAHNMATEMELVLENLDLRGELFFFRLAKYFPKHLRQVHCFKDRTIEVVFKNGQRIRGVEDNVENADFLARCGMVYDL